VSFPQISCTLYINYTALHYHKLKATLNQQFDATTYQLTNLFDACNTEFILSLGL